MFKNKNTLKGFLTIMTFLIALLILVFMSAPGIKIGNNTHSCLELVNGYKFGSTKMTGFSFLNLLPYIILVILLVFEYLKYVVNIFNNRTTRIVMTIAFVIIGVMFFLSKFMVNDVNPGAGYNKYPKEIAWGSIVQAIVAFICAILSACDAIVDFEYEDNKTVTTSSDINDLKREYAEELKKFNNEDEQ